MADILERLRLPQLAAERMAAAAALPAASAAEVRTQRNAQERLAVLSRTTVTPDHFLVLGLGHAVTVRSGQCTSSSDYNHRS